MLAGAQSRSRLFKVAPAASFWQAEKESLVVVTKPVFRIRVFFMDTGQNFFLSPDPDRPKIRIRIRIREKNLPKLE